MMPPIAMTSALPPVDGDGCGTGVAVEVGRVAVGCVAVSRVAVGRVAVDVAVAVLVWVGICI